MSDSYIKLKVGSSKHFEEKQARRYVNILKDHHLYKDVKTIRDREGKYGFVVLFKKK